MHFAAVSSSGSLIFLMVGFFNGIAVGAGVVISKYFGAADYDGLKKAVHTNIAFGLVSGCILTAVGMILAPQILVLMGTPESVLPNSIVYFRVYFAGSVAFVMYNIVMGILQAVGDSRHPLYYLIFSSIVNIVLDLLFVGLLGFGVGAAALATIISQFSSAFLCMLRLMRTKDVYQVQISQIRFHKGMLGQIIGIGLPSGMQNSIISFANIIVQTNINKFGVMAVAGCGVYSKIEGFAFLPITCFAMSLTTFIGQNLGAKQYDRAKKKGAYFGITCSTLLAEVVGVIVFLQFRSLQRHLTMKRRLLNLQPQTGSHRSIFLLLSGIFALYRRYHARCGKIYRANVCHACILVHHKNYIHHGYRAFIPKIRSSSGRTR